MSDTTFTEAAQTVTAPGYQPLPFDEDISFFQELGRALIETRDDMTAEEFAAFCQESDWIGGSAAEITPFLDALKKSEEE